MWIRGCKRQMNSLKVKGKKEKAVRGAQEESWSAARRGGESAGSGSHVLDVLFMLSFFFFLPIYARSDDML